MKILIDECVPRRFKKLLVGHHCETVPDVGLAGLANGSLLSAAESRGFEVFLTLDSNIEHQQNFVARRIAMVVLRCPSNHFSKVLPFAAQCLAALGSIQPGQIVVISQ